MVMSACPRRIRTRSGKCWQCMRRACLHYVLSIDRLRRYYDEILRRRNRQTLLHEHDRILPTLEENARENSGNKKTSKGVTYAKNERLGILHSFCRIIYTTFIFLDEFTVDF